MLKIYQKPIIQEIKYAEADKRIISISIKREDLIHPFVSGNKWRKLIYNLEEAENQGYDRLLTFGGAYSNHIYATAAAAKESGFKSIGIIRGDELAITPLNKTLSFAKDQGMELQFVDRETYRNKTNPQFLDLLKKKQGDFYLIPEGGTNNLAIRGCEEILNEETNAFDYIVTAVGTGGTISGIISASNEYQNILGISSLKGDFLKNEVESLLEAYGKPKTNWSINSEYHFGGYAKTTPGLINFIDDFEKSQNIPLDQVYTGKMMYAIYDLIKKDYFPTGSKILAIHTGGLQGKNNFAKKLELNK